MDVDSSSILDSTDVHLFDSANKNSFDSLNDVLLTGLKAPTPPDLIAPLFPVFNIYRDSYPCFDDAEYAKLPKPGRRRSLFYSDLVYTDLVCPPTHPSVLQPLCILREPVLMPLDCNVVLSVPPVVPPIPPRGGGMAYQPLCRRARAHLSQNLKDLHDGTTVIG